MRSTVILGTLLAVIGLGSVALASDDRNMSDRAAHEAAEHRYGDRHERYEHARDRSHEVREHRRKSRADHDRDERRESRDRR